METITLISNIFIYPDNLKDFRLDCRSPFGKPFMLVSFDYIQNQKTYERIIEFEKTLNEIAEICDVDFEDMEIKPVSVRKYITTRHVETTIFKPSYSLS